MPTHSAVLLHALLSLMPAMAQGADWSFDSVYGAASVLALPGGQATLVRDGAGQQTHSLSYMPGDGTTPVSIARAYGPHDRKTIESENGTTRHHVYGPGLAPILRMDSDGGFIYQLGLDTVVVDAAGAVTLAHRVVDLKSSTVAVLDAPGQPPGQRVSYASFGGMRLEQTGTDPLTEAVLEAAYEGLAVRLLGSDQLVDNRARQYAPASGRFLALDRAGQATAYEARGNNPVSRVDPDGNLNFDQLIAALKQDRSIPIAFADMHDSLEMPYALFYFIARLWQEGIPFHIFQEANLLAESPATELVVRERYLGSQLFIPVLDLLIKGLVTDLGIPHMEVTGALAAEIRATYASRNLAGDCKVSQSMFDLWNSTIPEALKVTKELNVVPIFFMGANHFLNFEAAVHIHPLRIYGTNKVLERNGELSLIPLSSYGMMLKYGLVTVFHNDFANVIPPGAPVLTALDFRLGAGSKLPFPYQVHIPEKALMEHPALIPPYSKELISHFEMKPIKPNQNNDSDEKDEEKESDEKKDADNMPNSARPALVLPLNKPGNASSFPKFDEKQVDEE